ncbi:glycine betaine/proline transport system permease protein [Spinactinospora alkalitolerans]|uniref:Glycine betaine/proline transport system permease protein n=1 Tax=Spinactinospora alkalitolerans TaxID=687207 RepID=A0A852U5X0_9ACTN|nr:ABC transporter permease subunit [Spinactinospora alkalitolerans]NYE50263.1 glycine betaine/proline transport system permease protein [Spinactinospora alkalitolerans]
MTVYALDSVRSVSVPRIPVGVWFENAINWLRANLGPVFDLIGSIIGVSVETLSELFTEPPAALLTVIAASVVTAGLLRRKWTRLAGVMWAAFLVLYAVELAFGGVALAIQSMPPALFVWAITLFGAEYVYPPLVLAILLLAALVIGSFVVTREPRQRYICIGSVAALLAALVLHFIVGMQIDLITVLLLAGLAWVVAGWRLAVFSLLGFLLIISMDKWTEAMSSLALILVATLIAVVIAVPIGVLAAYSNRVSGVLKPLLDFMQTLPAFVYLIPAIFFFGIGQVPGVIATVIFAMPPGVRLTELGIRQVDKELVEAGEAFGAPELQILRRIQLPLALSTIMAGINQVIMLSLSMVVISGMVGAGGLGNTVYTGIARSDMPLGFEGGIAVVILAIFLDRLTGAITRYSPAARAQRTAAG